MGWLVPVPDPSLVLLPYLLTALLQGAVVGPPPASAAAVPSRATNAGPIFDGRAGQTAVRIPRQDAALNVDGRLDEPGWAQAATLTGFSQFFPTDGIAAQHRTEVLVWYSGAALHIGIRAFADQGSVRATLAERDKIAQDDHVQFFIGTYNDSRQALVFAVNPFGIQSDGVLTETGASAGGGFLQNNNRSRELPDLAPDYVWQSKGRLTDTGYEVEIAIPFKSLRYRAGDEQTWQFNVLRVVQAVGHEQTWTPALRGSASFLTQSGELRGLRDLQRGLTVDLIPTITSSANGARATSTPDWRYTAARPELGGSARWGITSNLTLSATANPDFSQVEADATQYAIDPRVAVYFPERRPFFLESQEQFTTPNRLIYTRRIAQPVFSAKLTGKHQGFDIGVMSAVDSREASATGRDAPRYQIARIQRDIGQQSRVGVVYTDKADGAAWNRVVGVDGRFVRGLWSLQGQGAASFTGGQQGTERAPLWDLSLMRNGRALYTRYAFNGIDENFDAQSGFIARAGVANLSTTHRWNRFGRAGGFFEVISPEVFTLLRYRYADLVNRRPSQDRQLHLRLNSRLRGGWQVGTQFLVESFGYAPDLYARYVLLKPASNGRVDTVGYSGGRLPNYDGVLSVTSPEFRKFSFTSLAIFGQDENFQEWDSAFITNLQQSLNLRPTEQLRIQGTAQYEAFRRKTDGTNVLTRRTSRLRVEYQLTRQVFIRTIGELTIVEQDALRDVSRSELPIYLRDSAGRLTLASAFERQRARLDVLFSYLPTPGTVFYVGYGDALAADRPAGPLQLQRARDVFFAKFSYLFRVQ